MINFNKPIISEKIKILLAEDELIVALDIKSTLLRYGYRHIRIARNGNEAYNLFKKEKPEVILLDIIMDGDEDGIIAAQRINSESKTPIIFITASTNKTIFNKAKSENPVDILCKPFIEPDLIKALEKAVQYKS